MQLRDNAEHKNTFMFERVFVFSREDGIFALGLLR
jgi:hypothetical protein